MRRQFQGMETFRVLFVGEQNPLGPLVFHDQQETFFLSAAVTRTSRGSQPKRSKRLKWWEVDDFILDRDLHDS